eukprot:PhF_6_TR30364/c0_g1_i3/m.44468
MEGDALLNALLSQLVGSREEFQAMLRDIATEIREILEDFPEGPHRAQYYDACLNLDRFQDQETDPAMMAILSHQAKALLRQVKKNAQWPRAPLPLPEGTIQYPVIYHRHDRYGLLLLRFSNPLPMPAAGMICDLCRGGIQNGYQCVDQEGRRDVSSFDVGFSGFDSCFPCATKYFDSHVSNMLTWIREPVTPASVHVYHPHQVMKGHGISLTKMTSESGTPQGTTLEISMTPPGHKVVLVPGAVFANHDAKPGDIPWETLHRYSEATYAPVQRVSDDCCICLESLSDVAGGKMSASRTPCGHYFHEGCIQKHRRAELQSKREDKGEIGCPLCRTMVKLAEIDTVTESQSVTVRWREEEVAAASPTLLSRGDWYVFLTGDEINLHTAATVVLRIPRS